MALTAEQIRELVAQVGNPNYDLNPEMGALANKSPVIPPRSDLSMTPGFQGEMGGFTPPIPGGGMPLGGGGGLGGGAMQGGFGMGGGGGFDPMGMPSGMSGIPGRHGSFPLTEPPYGAAGTLDTGGSQNYAPFTPQSNLEDILPADYLHAEDRNVLDPFRRPPAEFDKVTGQMRVRQPKNYSLLPQQPQRFGIDPISGEEYGARAVNKFPPAGAQYPGTISSMFSGPF